MATSSSEVLPPPRIILLGESGVGKSNFARAAVHSRHDRPYIQLTLESTMAYDMLFSTRSLGDGRKLHVCIVDTAGQERFASIVASHYRNAAAAVLMFDVGNEESFRRLDFWLREINEKLTELPILFVVGTKSDLAPDKRVVDKESGENYAARIGATYLETNSKDANGCIARVTLDIIVRTMVRTGIKVYPPVIRIDCSPPTAQTKQIKGGCRCNK